MKAQKYWLELGQRVDGTPYAKGVINSDYWLQSALNDDYTPVLVEIKVNPKTGHVSADFRKNVLMEAS